MRLNDEKQDILAGKCEPPRRTMFPFDASHAGRGGTIRFPDGERDLRPFKGQLLGPRALGRWPRSPGRAPTTACPTTGAATDPRRSAIVSITCGRPCGCTNIPTAGWPFLMARAVLSVLTRKDVAVTSPLAPLKSAWRPTGLWVCGQRKSVDRLNSNKRTGQMMCYKPRRGAPTPRNAALASSRLSATAPLGPWDGARAAR